MLIFRFETKLKPSEYQKTSEYTYLLSGWPSAGLSGRLSLETFRSCTGPLLWVSAGWTRWIQRAQPDSAILGFCEISLTNIRSQKRDFQWSGRGCFIVSLWTKICLVRWSLELDGEFWEFWYEKCSFERLFYVYQEADTGSLKRDIQI